MKSKLLFILALFLLLFVLMNQNNRFIRNLALEFVNPLKKDYRDFSKKVQRASYTYLFQKETIKELRKENRRLRKYLFDQSNYIKQLATIYKKLPFLSKLPYRSIVLVDTISYVKLNKFDTILLDMPKHYKLKEGKIYGLIQNEVVAGTARLENGNLYGYMISSPQCMFSVYVGKDRVPGVAKGIDKNLMEVKFMPKWAKIKEGDLVETSGLDNLFFANIPVGVVTKVVEEGSYKKAYIETYADTIHPSVFFLITDPKPYLASEYEQNKTLPDEEYKFANQKPLKKDENISSIPVMIQTKELEIDPAEFKIPHEETHPKRVIQKEKPKVIKEKNTINETPKSIKPIKKKVKVVKPVAVQTKIQKQDTPKAKPKPKPKKRRRPPSPFDILRVEPTF